MTLPANNNAAIRPVPPHVGQVGLPDELVGAHVGEDDGLGLLHPVLDPLHPGHGDAGLEEEGTAEFGDDGPIPGEQLRDDRVQAGAVQRKAEYIIISRNIILQISHPDYT